MYELILVLRFCWISFRSWLHPAARSNPSHTKCHEQYDSILGKMQNKQEHKTSSATKNIVHHTKRITAQAVVLMPLNAALYTKLCTKQKSHSSAGASPRKSPHLHAPVRPV